MQYSAGPAPPPPPASSAWVQLPSAPVCGRQEVGAAIVDGDVYYVGGFSVRPPSLESGLCYALFVVFRAKVAQYQRFMCKTYLHLSVFLAIRGF